MKSRLAVFFFGLAALLLGGAAIWAQPKVALPGPPSPPAKFSVTGGPEAAGVVAVAPGPEPWYTVFATGEVIGYIEPCG